MTDIMGRESLSQFQDGANIPSSKILFGLLYVLLIGLLMVNWEVVVALTVHWWTSATYGYGLLVFPISVYLIWEKRSKIFSNTPKPDVWGLLVLMVASCMWWLATLVDIQIIQQFSLVVLVAGLVWALLGGRTFRLLIFPLVYLFLTIPMWGPLESLLQTFTVHAVMLLLGWVGVPAFLEGHFISIPSGQFHVEEVCAGLRYVLAITAISCLYAYLYLRTRWEQIAFFLFALVLAVGVNWARVFFVVWAGHLTDMQHWLVHSHVEFGWWLFIAVLIPLFWGGAILRKQGSIEQIVRNDHESVNHSAATSLNKVQIAIVACVVSILVFTPLSTRWLTHADTNVVSVAISLNDLSGPWVGPIDPGNVWQPVFKGADAESLSAYAMGEMQIIHYVAYYHQQRQGSELINELNKVYDEQQWKMIETQRKTVSINGRQGLDINESIIHSSAGKKRVVWYWYCVGGVLTASPIAVKLLHAWDLVSDRKGSAIVAVSTAYENEPESMHVLLESYMSLIEPIPIAQFVTL